MSSVRQATALIAPSFYPGSKAAGLGSNITARIVSTGEDAMLGGAGSNVS